MRIELVIPHRLRGADKTKYEIYDALCKHVPQCKSWEELREKLAREGIDVGFKNKGSTDLVEGVRFTKDGITFNGSKVDRKFSYAKIDYQLNHNRRAEEHVKRQTFEPQQTETSHHQATENISIGLGLFDLPQGGDDPDEEQFRKRMQKKKKKGFRI